jgi:hypothetical protein
MSVTLRFTYFQTRLAEMQKVCILEPYTEPSNFDDFDDFDRDREGSIHVTFTKEGDTWVLQQPLEPKIKTIPRAKEILKQLNEEAIKNNIGIGNRIIIEEVSYPKIQRMEYDFSPIKKYVNLYKPAGGKNKTRRLRKKRKSIRKRRN